MLNLFDLFGLVASLFAGILLGYFSRDRKRVDLNRVIFWVILSLIFCLGFSIGSNRALLDSMPSVGLDAVVLSLSAMVFSVFFVSVARKLVQVD